ncbi:MAG TPA: hypothetical protein VHJ17_11620 [Thermomonospora sp.]|nr:hypothetical protein [Thermomonospora sp.]
MAERGALVTITAGTSPVRVMDGRVWAVLVDAPRPTRFVATAEEGAIRFADRSTGRLLYAPSPEPFTQLALAPPGEQPELSRWILRDADGAPVERLTASGLYTLELAGTGEHLGRYFHEEITLLPKKLVLLPAGVQPPRLALSVLTPDTTPHAGVAGRSGADARA